jgi:hypothetical protein
MQLIRGQQIPLSNLSSTTFRINIAITGVNVDISCFGVDALGRVIN